MKRIVYQGNKTLQLVDQAEPALNPDQVRIRVAYSGICGTDQHIYLGHYGPRISIPHVPGHEASGTVVEVGKNIADFRKNDKVVVMPVVSCGKCPSCKLGYPNTCYALSVIGVDAPGTFQETMVVAAKNLHHLPDEIDLKVAALIEPLAVASHDIRIGGVTQGDNVVVLGGGPIGALIALLGHNRGAHVIVSEVSKYRREFIREFGIDVVNPVDTDLNQYVLKNTGGVGADIVYEVTGSPSVSATMTKIVRAHGRIIFVGIYAKPIDIDMNQFIWKELETRAVRLHQIEDFDSAIQYVMKNKNSLERFITDTRTLEQVPQTFREIETGADFMKVLIKMNAP